MGWLIEGLGGASDPRADFWASVRYAKLHPVLDAAYQRIDPFELRWVSEAGLLPLTATVATEEQKVQVERICLAFAAAQDADCLHIWRDNLPAIADSDDPAALVAELTRQEAEDHARACTADQAVLDSQCKIWESMMQQERDLLTAMYQWEQSHWANALTCGDSPYFGLPVQSEYDSVYRFLSVTVQAEDY